MGRFRFPLCLAVALLLSLAPAAFSNTLPNGLQLERFEVAVQGASVAGATVQVEMTLRNLEPVPIRFEAPGIFVAARTSDLSDRGNRDFGHQHVQGYTLDGGQTLIVTASRTIDKAGTWHFWPGFKMNGAWGPFRWMEKTLLFEAPGNPQQSSAQGEPSSGGPLVSVAELLAAPENYDGRTVSLEARAVIVRKKRGFLVSLADMQDADKVLTAFGAGTTEASNGDKVRVTGVFKHASRRGRYTYNNEIAVEKGGLTVVDKGSSYQSDFGSKTLDYRSQVRAPFELGPRAARGYAIGEEVPVRFWTRCYTDAPKARTLVREGSGAASYQAVRWEAGKKLLGKGIGSPGKGLTWLAVHLKLKGGTDNEGKPDRWSQFPMGENPAPCFFVAARGGKVFWPDTASQVVVNRERTYTPADKVKLNDPEWRPTALVFKVSEEIQDPVLVCVTWNGGSEFEYTAIPLE
jgi:hypothetical protein